MEKQMNRRLKLGLIVAILAIVVVIATFSAMVLIPALHLRETSPCDQALFEATLSFFMW